ncbi:MAG: stage II sporulation protein M [Micromonosporaceae bacterium]
MDLDAFVAEHAGEWRRLEWLSTRRRKLSAEQADELVMLYQRTATHLSLIRSRSPDPALVARLSRLVLTARGALTGSPARLWPTVIRFFSESFPVAVYRAWPWWAAVSLAFVVVAGWLMVHYATHPGDVLRFVSEQEVEDIVNTSFEAYYRQSLPQNFAFAVWTNNTFVSAICLASGVLVAPVLFVLFMNAFNIGLTGGIMIGHGRADVFFGLILVHGLLELTCVFIAAGVGLRIGWSWIAPGPYRTRGQALAEAGRAGMVVALGLGGALLVSGIIEAFVTPYVPTLLALPIGALAWLGFLAYVVLLGRPAAHAGLTGDLAAHERESVAPTA